MESKPGIRTTEWWAGIAASAALWATHAAQSGQLPLKWAATLQTVVAVGYAISRGLAKLGQPYVPAEFDGE